MFFLSCALVVFAIFGQSTGLGPMTDNILDTTGLDRKAFSTIYSLATLIGSLLAPIVGRAVDRFGIRKNTLTSLLLLALIFFILGKTGIIYDGFFGRICHKTTFFAVFFLLIFPFLRLLGQSVLPMLGKMQIIENFGEKCGIAVAIGGIFFAMAAGFIPDIIRGMVQHRGWQDVLGTLAMVSGVAFVIFFIFFYDVSARTFARQRERSKMQNPWNKNFTQQLVKTPIFWFIAPALCLNAFIDSGTTVHITDILIRSGTDPHSVMVMYPISSCISIGAGLFFGTKMDGGKVKTCLLAVLFFQLLELVGLEAVQNASGRNLYIICAGCAWGGGGILKTVSWAKIFGRQELGSILGVAYCLCTLASSMGVAAFGIAAGLDGSYFRLMHILEGLILGIILFAAIKFPPTARITPPVGSE
jgi:MFS family permease